MTQVLQNLVVLAVVVAASVYLLWLAVRRRKGEHACAQCAARIKQGSRRTVRSH